MYTNSITRQTLLSGIWNTNQANVHSLLCFQFILGVLELHWNGTGVVLLELWKKSLKGRDLSEQDLPALAFHSLKKSWV